MNEKPCSACGDVALSDSDLCINCQIEWDHLQEIDEKMTMEEYLNEPLQAGACEPHREKNNDQER